MTKDYKYTQKMIDSLHHYIIDLDSLRPPLSFINPRFFAFFKVFSNFSKLGQKSDLFRKTPNLHRKLGRELNPYFKEVLKITLKDIVLYLSGCFLIKILLIIIHMILSENTVLNFIMIIIEITWIIFLLIWIFTTHMRVAGEKYDEQIKKATQELIDCELELIKEKNVNTKYHINLKHNDYHGLK